nr:hypothetical protein [Herbidospora cretacea]
MPTTSVPAGTASRAVSTPSAHWASRFRATGSRARPCGVRETPAGSRVKRGKPRWRSSARICFDSAGWETKSRSAARVKWRSSATATK